MIIKKLAVVFLSAAILVGVLSSCSADEKAKAKEKTVNVGYFPNLTHAQALVGLETGSFQESLGKDIKLNWVQFNAGPAAMGSLFSENLDIAYIGSGPAINGYIKSKGDIQIISGAVNGGAVLLVGKDEKIDSIKDLSGKKISIPQYGNTQDIALRKLLKEAGLKDKSKGGTVDVVQAKGGDTLTLLENGDISAAVVPEPWGAIIEKRLGAKVLLDEKELYRNGEYSTTLLVARKEFAKENPEIIESFLKTHDEITEYIVNNPKEAKEKIGNQLLKLTTKELPKGVIDMSFNRMTLSVDPKREALEDMTKTLKDIGYIRKTDEIKDIVLKR